METNRIRTLQRCVTASPFFRIGSTLLIIALIYSNWERYGIADNTHHVSEDVLLWTICFVIITSMIDGICRFIRRASVQDAGLANRDKESDRTQLQLICIWLAAAILGRLFLKVSIDRFIALYVGPMFVLLLIANLLSSYLHRKQKQKTFFA